MGLAGNWSAQYANANNYVGALRWGTGINPIHEEWGEGPPTRVYGRPAGPDGGEFESEGLPVELVNPDILGYTPEDMEILQTYSGAPPPVGTETSEFREDADNYPPWYPGGPTDSGAAFRARAEGAEVDRAVPRSYPTETVSEGWLNKVSGQVNDAETSNPAQYERQTSMQQVNPGAGRNNSAAVARGTDDPRAKIMTRLTGMKLKFFSGGQRHADMFPYQQDMMVRPFHYRTAATGHPDWMEVNEMYVSDPINREVPALPYTGPPETNVEEYGYTPEDSYGY